MFHARLAILLVATVGGLVLLAAQATRLTTLRHAEAFAVAESKLVRTTWKNATRGRILDRRGRVLAHDRPGYAVAVDYDLITGAWSEAQAGRAARTLHRDDWPELSTVQRAELVDRYRPRFDEHLAACWRTIARVTGEPIDEIDRRRERTVERVSGRYAHIVDVRLRIEIERRLRLGQEITEELETQLAEKAGRPIREQTDAHVLVPAVSDATGFELRRRLAERVAVVKGTRPVPVLPGVSVPDLGRREYPMSSVEVAVDRGSLPAPIRSDEPWSATVRGVGSHLLGWTRATLYREDIERRAASLETDATLAEAVAAVGSREVDRGRYVSGDRIGNAGLEASLEDTLRGWRGVEIERLDSGDRSLIDETPGRDVRLTLDAELQARVHALLDPRFGLTRVQPWHDNQTLPVGTELHAAAVVLDVSTGEILAMVSTPTFVVDDAGGPEPLPAARLDDPIARPLVNRAVEAPYPPGSIVKAFMLPAAVRHGLVDINHRQECTGHLLPNKPLSYRCWIYKRFGYRHQPEDYRDEGLSVDEAIKGSCNIFFYDLGRRLGPELMPGVYDAIGVGRPWNLPLANTFPGTIGRPGTDGRLEPNEAIFLGMGQGPVAWTPLHAATAFATLARGGVRVEPRLLLDAPRAEPVELAWPSAPIERSLHGLWRVVNDRDGTAASIATERGREPIFNTPGVAVWGKTGTAAAPPLVEDGRVLREGDHSWFVALVGPGHGESAQPTHAIAVITEYGGSGGRVSGPIANQIVRSLVATGLLTPAPPLAADRSTALAP
ncbi:MAG: penicillin-binding transpeptidase domain-containing protein [Planctomycetota bacterium]